MNKWEINHEDGSSEIFNETTDGDLDKYLQLKYPGKHLEAFTDQWFVFNKPEDYQNGVDPIASANAC